MTGNPSDRSTTGPWTRGYLRCRGYCHCGVPCDYKRNHYGPCDHVGPCDGTPLAEVEA